MLTPIMFCFVSAMVALDIHYPIGKTRIFDCAVNSNAFVKQIRGHGGDKAIYAACFWCGYPLLHKGEHAICAIIAALILDWKGNF